LSARVTAYGPELGSQIVAEGMRLTGLTYDRGDDIFVIWFAREGEEVFEHVVDHPQKILVATVDGVESIDVEDAERRHTIVSLEPELELPAPGSQ
jgi:hypothetical protein